MRFDVFLPSHAGLSRQQIELDRDDIVTITLETPASIRGIVVDAESREPVRQFRARLAFSPDRRPSDPNGSFNSDWGNPGITFNSNDGRFAIGPLVNGLPLAVTIEADGFERLTLPRAIAAKSGNSENEVTVALKRAIAIPPFALKGQLLDYTGKGTPGALLRLIVSADQPTGMNDNRFNWVLIKNGQLGDRTYCEQFLSAKTDAEGRFEFRDVLPGKYLQLAYWGAGVPQGRSLAFDETKPGATETVTIRLPQPATVRGTIDRTKLANAHLIRISTDRETWLDHEIKLEADQTAFNFQDLPPGKYNLYLMGKPVPFVENGQRFSRSSTVVHVSMELRPGENKQLELTEPNAQR